MHPLAAIVGFVLILATLLDAFETILVPRRVNHRFRYSRLYYRNGWRLWRRAAAVVPAGRWRESMLSNFGPLSMLGLFISWVASLIFGFACLQWSLARSLLTVNEIAGPQHISSYLYYSGTTYFTLGLGDVLPAGGIGRTLTVLEGGLGFGFLAIIIGYLPVLYQAFSKREVTISLMDARCGSPPSCGEYLARLAREGPLHADDNLLREWEHWSAELLESHISFPVLAMYRSQHSNQSWLAALATMLDVCAALVTLLPASESHQAQLTFAMARHAVVDIALIFDVRPVAPNLGRLRTADTEDFQELLRAADRSGIPPSDIVRRLAALRGTYEPFLEALAKNFLLTLPPIAVANNPADNWQRSSWMPQIPGIGSLPPGKSEGDHFG